MNMLVYSHYFVSLPLFVSPTSSASLCFCLSSLSIPASKPLRGHPFTTSTRRGDQAQVDACGRRRVSQAPCGRPRRKLKVVHQCHPVFLSCKEVGVFLAEFRLSME